MIVFVDIIQILMFYNAISFSYDVREKEYTNHVLDMYSMTNMQNRSGHFETLELKLEML